MMVKVIVAAAGITVTWEVSANVNDVLEHVESAYGDADDVYSFDAADGIVVIDS